MTLSSAHAVAKKCSFLNSILNTNQFRLSKCMKRLLVNTGIFHRLCFTYLSPYTTIILYLFIGGLHMEDKQLVAELKKKIHRKPTRRYDSWTRKKHEWQWSAGYVVLFKWRWLRWWIWWWRFFHFLTYSSYFPYHFISGMGFFLSFMITNFPIK